MPAALTFTDVVPDYRAPTGGSSNVMFYLDVTQHQAYLDAIHDAVTTAAAGWYRLFRDLQGGAITDTFGNVTEVKNEAGEKVASTAEDNSVVISNSVMGTDARTLNTIRWMQGLTEGLPVRYPLPVTAEGTYDTITDPAKTIATMYGFHAVTARKIDAGVNTGEGEQRAKPIELVANADEAYSNLYEVAEVDLEDDTTWPARMAPFKDTPA